MLHDASATHNVVKLFMKLLLKLLFLEASTLDSGIDVAPVINVAPSLKNFHITILTLFYINLGIAVIFDFIFSSIFFKN